MPDIRTRTLSGGTIMHILAPLLLLAAAQTAPAVDIPQPLTLPNGFVDPSGRFGIFNTPSGGVQVVELATGKPFFQTNQAKRPLFFAGDRLYALEAVKAPIIRSLCFEWRPAWDGPRNGFRLVAFDLAQFGDRVLESETVALPEWASIVETHERSFAFRWHTENGRLVVAWEAKTWYAGLTRKTPAEEAAYRKQATGTIRFDLQTAAVEALPPQPPPSEAPLFEPWPELERLSIRWYKRSATQLFLATLDEAENKQTLSLRIFDLATRQQISIAPLKTGVNLAILPTLDEQYLCVREGMVSPDQVDGEKSQQRLWSIFAVNGGQQLAEVPFEPGMTTAVILGGRIYFLSARQIKGSIDRPFVVPRSLLAVDLRTGMTVWERPVGGKPSSPPPVVVWPAPSAQPPAKKVASQP
jgi:hypothetical protein